MICVSIGLFFFKLPIRIGIGGDLDASLMCTSTYGKVVLLEAAGVGHGTALAAAVLVRTVEVRVVRPFLVTLQPNSAAAKLENYTRLQYIPISKSFRNSPITINNIDKQVQLISVQFAEKGIGGSNHLFFMLNVWMNAKQPRTHAPQLLFRVDEGEEVGGADDTTTQQFKTLFRDRRHKTRTLIQR